MVGIPWRVALALRYDGWYLRSDVIWAKPNPMPESVRDRPTRAHEYVFLFSKSPSPWYYYDAEAVRKPASSRYQHWARRELYADHGNGQTLRGRGSGHQVLGNFAIGRNLRSVWTIATQPYHGLPLATFPTRLVARCIHAGSSALGCCQRCGAPWERAGPKYLGWRPTCDCQVSDPVPSVVLDPFAGSGTTLAVAAGLGRQAIGVELNPDYVQLIRRRCSALTTLLKSKGAA
jgi:DNA modification methylase